MILNFLFHCYIFFQGLFFKLRLKNFAIILACCIVFDVHGLKYFNYSLSPIDIFFLILLIRFFIGKFNLENDINLKLSNFELFYIFNFLLLFVILVIDFILNKGFLFNYLLRPLFYFLCSYFILCELNKTNKILFLLILTKAITFLSFSIVLFQTFIPQFEYYVLSSTYELEGIRVQGSNIGRALGPSREPSHLLPLVLLCIILTIRIFKKNIILYTFIWFLIGYLTDSRAIMILVPIFFIICNLSIKSFLSIKNIFFVIPLFVLISFNITRLDGALSLDTDISVMQRLGSILIITLNYLNNTFSHSGLFNFNPQICNTFNKDLIFSIDNELCLVYTPVLNWSINMAFSLPLFIVPIIWAYFSFRNYLSFLLIISFIVSGIFFYIFASPVVIFYLLSSRIIYKLNYE